VKNEYLEQLTKIRDADVLGPEDEILKIETILQYGNLPISSKVTLAPSEINIHNMAILIQYFSNIKLEPSKMQDNENLYLDLNKILNRVYSVTHYRELPNQNIFKWKSKPFLALLILILENNLFNTGIQEIIKYVNNFQECLVDIESSYAAALEKQNVLKEEKKENLKIPQNQLKEASSLQISQESSDWKTLYKNQNVKKASLRNIENIIRLVEANFPWPVDNLSIHPFELNKLKQYGIHVNGNKAWKYDLMPIDFDSNLKIFHFNQFEVDKWKKENRGSKSYFEPYAYKFPDSIKLLVENFQEFCRYLNHKKRYLVESIHLDLVFLDHNFSLRIDQVAIQKKNQELSGRWVTTLFGAPDSLRAVIQQLDFSPIKSLKLFDKISLNNEQMTFLDNVFILQSVTPERMRTLIGRFLELFVLIALEPSTASSLRTKEFSQHEKKERESIFETALRTSFWDSETRSRDSIHKCQICGQPIWDGPSLARMMGPECWKKHRFTRKGQALISISDGRKIDKSENLHLVKPFELWVREIVRDLVIPT